MQGRWHGFSPTWQHGGRLATKHAGKLDFMLDIAKSFWLAGS